MKVLGVKQFHQMRFKFLPVQGELSRTLGDIPHNFIAVVYGYSGNGKTEFCMRLAKMLCAFGKVAWLSYEQRHGSDLQAATLRNRMDEVSGQFYPIDPIANRADNVGLLEDLDNYLKKRNSPDYIFIDSLDYTGFTWNDYVFLRNRYGEKKGLIFIAHSHKSGRLKKAISEQIVFDGGLGIWVCNYIARPEKNRFGGFEPYVVWEEMAREKDPAFFAKQVHEKPTAKGKGKKATKQDDGTGLPDGSPAENQGQRAKNGSEKGGVRAIINHEN
jgi:hypothetical protein